MAHEDVSRKEVVRGSSNRSFGLTIGTVLGLIGIFSLFFGRHAAWWLGGSIAFVAAGLAVPDVLAPLNRLWFRLGLALHAVVNPVILGLMFFTVITPLGLLMRLLGKRPLNLRFDPAAPTYWSRRDPPGPARDSFPNQF